ncbi:hypothetical protein T4D_13656 [Trichinella pseudospiralis]|uniref:Uncharacterized protein n=1 Tax=Trichinella pseudospiralis TaxID=6337 RepID=A0A0V1F2J5_TRIPS|nr:hypothetical protein T4D_13656 [Trichinella pseudospiralis]
MASGGWIWRYSGIRGLNNSPPRWLKGVAGGFPVEFLPQFTNDSAEQEQPLRDCPSQRFNKPDSYHNLFIVS